MLYKNICVLLAVVLIASSGLSSSVAGKTSKLSPKERDRLSGKPVRQHSLFNINSDGTFSFKRSKNVTEMLAREKKLIKLIVSWTPITTIIWSLQASRFRRIFLLVRHRLRLPVGPTHQRHTLLCADLFRWRPILYDRIPSTYSHEHFLRDHRPDWLPNWFDHQSRRKLPQIA